MGGEGRAGQGREGRVCLVLKLPVVMPFRFVSGPSSVSEWFGFASVRVLHRRNWKHVTMVVIRYGLTVIVSTS